MGECFSIRIRFGGHRSRFYLILGLGIMSNFEIELPNLGIPTFSSLILKNKFRLILFELVSEAS